MISLSGIALVENDPVAARLVVETARLCFGKAVWHTTSSIAQLIDWLDDGERFRLILIDALAFDKTLLCAQLTQLTEHPRLFATPVLLLVTDTDQPTLRAVYEAGVSACHTKPQTATAWTELLTQIHRYWFMINLVPPRRLLR